MKSAPLLPTLLGARGIARNWVAFRDSLIKAGNWTGTHWENGR